MRVLRERVCALARPTAQVQVSAPRGLVVLCSGVMCLLVHARRCETDNAHTLDNGYMVDPALYLEARRERLAAIFLEVP